MCVTDCCIVCVFFFFLFFCLVPSLCCFFFLMLRRPPRSTRTDTLFPYTTLFRSYVERRHVIARRYDARLAGLPLVLPYQSPDAHSALHLYPVQIEDASQRRRVFEGMRTAGNGVNVHYIPVALQHRSEERRVGKECVSSGRSIGWQDNNKKKKK